MHISTTPWDWNNDDIVHQCDSMNFVLDAAHAERFERITSRRGVLLTIEQTALFVKATGDARMWDYDWAPATINPQAVVLGHEAARRGRERLDGGADPGPGYRLSRP